MTSWTGAISWLIFVNLAVCNDDFQNPFSSKILKFNKAKEDFLSSKITRKSNPKVLRIDAIGQKLREKLQKKVDFWFLKSIIYQYILYTTKGERSIINVPFLFCLMWSNNQQPLAWKDLGAIHFKRGELLQYYKLSLFITSWLNERLGLKWCFQIK